MRRPGSGGVAWRTTFFFVCAVVLAIGAAFRLWVLMVADHASYQALASGQHEIIQTLFPKRGSIYIRDVKGATTVPLATNRRLAFVFADPRRIEDAARTTGLLAELFGYDEEQKEKLRDRLSRKEDPYEPVEHHVSDETLARLKELNLAGISTVDEDSRYYPEAALGGHIAGFFGMNEDGTSAGKYGIEGFFNELLAGKPGLVRSERDMAGRLISVGEQAFVPAENGVDIVLTIDQTIQYRVCHALKKAVAEHQADGGSVVVLDPSTGAVLAMCGSPDFDPANYGAVEGLHVYNNPAIFSAYEPGSVFKPITISAAIDAGVVGPDTTYEDTGLIVIDDHPIKNSDGLAHGIQTMTQVLERSLNTGSIFAMRQLGPDRFGEYVHAFGFGEKTGIELKTEVEGDLKAMDTGEEIFAATASYGQGLTVTPLQLAAAFAAIANGGILRRPSIVSEMRYPDGRVETREPQDIRRVVSARAARMTTAMMVSVVENGYGKKSGVRGYYIAGKTGTAQVAREDGHVGYQEGNTNTTFAGFGPVEDPKFVMVTRLDHPRDSQWAETTATPLFGEIAAFLLDYLEIPPTR